MAKCYIIEYQDAPQRQGTTIQCGTEPGRVNASSPLTFTTHVESAAFASDTKFVMISVDADAHYVFGLTPVATTSNQPIWATQHLVFGVYPGHKISVVAA
jgi:hypothetical protein